MISYLLALLPICIFIYLPLTQFLFGSSPRAPSPHYITLDESFIARDDPDLTCPPHSYSPHILSREPLVIYIEGFLEDGEIVHLLEISHDQFATSQVSTGPDTKTDPTIRLSEVATLPRSPTVQCIEKRARALQGWSPPHSHHRGHSHGNGDGQVAGLLLERLKLQRYSVGGHYTYHYDWQGGGMADRVSSFMVFVEANCTGGGTGFPRLAAPRDHNWCQFVECSTEWEGATGGRGAPPEGVVFKPVVGNAIYWENLREDGTGYTETWHAGLPILTGTKVGLNIWSWYQF